MKEIINEINKLEENIQYYTLLQPAISSGSVGWHVEHCLLVMNAVTNALSKSVPGTYKKKFSLSRSFVMLTGKIPRGKVKAPTAVQPNLSKDPAIIKTNIIQLKDKVKSLEGLSLDHYFTHPFLGDFKLKPALRFLKIHTNHHLKIIDDIIKSKS